MSVGGASGSGDGLSSWSAINNINAITTRAVDAPETVQRPAADLLALQLRDGVDAADGSPRRADRRRDAVATRELEEAAGREELERLELERANRQAPTGASGADKLQDGVDAEEDVKKALWHACPSCGSPVPALCGCDGGGQVKAFEADAFFAKLKAEQAVGRQDQAPTPPSPPSWDAGDSGGASPDRRRAV